MSDSDDQDKTRIQRRRPAAPPPPSARDAKPPSAPDTAARKQPPANRLRNTDRTLSLDPGDPAAPRAQLQTRDLLKNRFILEKVLGAGGMGVVYKAKDLLKVEAKDRDPYVAIKVLGEEFKSHPEAFIALQRESRKTQRIAHPNIVNVHDFDKDGDTVFMTMEYLEGTPLDKLIKKFAGKGLPSERAWPILDGLCAALAYAHDQRIIHSDLKPGNIFVTHQGITKVFDFGIARAVAKAEQGDAEDRTVFDAGNLGALTPAYASMEMLDGDPPDVRDDIYALGVIAYELLTGTHPYARKNAREARRAGMKPKRIEGITKQQWRAIEQALAFEREQRVATVKELWQALSEPRTSSLGSWVGGLLLVVISAAAVYLYTQWDEPQLPPQLSEDDFRSQIETKIRLELIHKNIADLLLDPSFSPRWESALWDEVQSLVLILGDQDESVIEVMGNVYGLYRERIRADVTAEDYAVARQRIEWARRYTRDMQILEALLTAIIAAEAEAQKLAEARRLAEEDQQRQAREQQAAEQQRQARQQDEQRVRQARDVALATIQEQLACNRLLNMEDLAIGVRELRNLDLAFYNQMEPSLINDLVDCIQKIGRNFPDRALAARNAGLELFTGNAKLRALEIAEQDVCGENLAGLGARGRRSICQDTLAAGGRGPELVVIPGKGNMAPFAIGRYEVSIGDFNLFCRASEACSPMPQANAALPVTGITLQLAQAYLQWLSDTSGRRYRLPSHAEWLHAAHANGRGLDANRNCRLNSRGIQKGGALVNAEIGQQNGWGLVNYVGNAQEWVTGADNRLLVAGGSFATAMEDCAIDLASGSSGNAEDETGFRVLRELRR